MRSPLLAALFLVACGGGEPSTPAPSPTPEPPPPAPQISPAAPVWTHVLDAADPKLTWTSKKNGDTAVPGTLQLASGELRIDPTDLATTTGTLVVELKGTASGDAVRDERLVRTFFQAAEPDRAQARVELDRVALEPKVIEVGQSAQGSAHYVLHLGPGKVEGEIRIAVERPDAERWAVRATEPATVSIAGLGLSTQLQALVTECGHKSVDDAVQIGAELVFVPKAPTAPATPGP
jgi:hypothetical protein